MRIDQFLKNEPKLVLEQFFDGRLKGWGIVQDRWGRPQRRVTVEAEGVWDRSAGVLSLKENWTFDDGGSDRLDWTIRPLGEGRYKGQEPRLQGTAQGEQAGNAYHWSYRRSVPAGKGRRVLSFDDWFWRIDDHVVVVRASVRKFGFEWLNLFLMYQKEVLP